MQMRVWLLGRRLTNPEKRKFSSHPAVNSIVSAASRTQGHSKPWISMGGFKEFECDPQTLCVAEAFLDSDSES